MNDKLWVPVDEKKTKGVLEFLRGIQRPVVITAVLVMMGFMIYVAAKFIDSETAKAIIFSITGAFGIVIGFLFGERSQKTK